MKQRNVVLLFIVTSILPMIFLGFRDGSEQVLYHQIHISASNIELVKWNIKDTSGISFVQEIIDDSGRTKELRFYDSRNNPSYTGSGFYGGPIIRYDYSRNKITETFFSSENEIANDFRYSEVPYRHIYYLNEEKGIEKITYKYKIDFEWSTESLESAVNHLQFYNGFSPERSEMTSVFGYSFAYAKLNGINPQQKK